MQGKDDQRLQSKLREFSKWGCVEESCKKGTSRDLGTTVTPSGAKMKVCCLFLVCSGVALVQSAAQRVRSEAQVHTGE